MTELRDFLIAQTAADEQSGALDEMAGREQRRAIVRHGESHICENERDSRNDPMEEAHSQAGPGWCHWLRELGLKYADRPGYEDRWRPYSDPYWDYLPD